jgi:hypothetical protein
MVRRVVGPNVAFFGKTGTLNWPRSSPNVDPVVATTLVFAIGHVPKAGGAGLSCGFVGTLYFRLNREVDRVDPLATMFANQRLWPVLRKHWDRLGVCRAPAKPRPPSRSRSQGVRVTASR